MQLIQSAFICTIYILFSLKEIFYISKGIKKCRCLKMSAQMCYIQDVFVFILTSWTLKHDIFNH